MTLAEFWREHISHWLAIALMIFGGVVMAAVVVDFALWIVEWVQR